MAEEQGQEKPGPPQGFQRPGIAGAGNVLDPEVRAELREQLHAAVPKPMPQPAGHAAPPAAPSAAPSPGDAAPSAASPPAQHRAGPFPHGDVDLSSFAANVPSSPMRPKRGRVRSYYFLKQAADTTSDEPSPAIQPPPGPKPG